MHPTLFSNTHRSGLESPVLPAAPSPDPLDATAFSHLDSSDVGIRQLWNPNLRSIILGLRYVAKPLSTFSMVGETIQGVMSWWTFRHSGHTDTLSKPLAQEISRSMYTIRPLVGVIVPQGRQTHQMQRKFNLG